MPTKAEAAAETAPKNIYAAMAEVRLALPQVQKDSTNPAFKSKYASLGAVQEAANPVLLAHGFVPLYSVRTDILAEDARQIVYTGLSLHYVPTGESLSSELGIVPVKQDAQGIGSAITYARRYLLTTMLDLTVDDDDGNAAAQGKRAQYVTPAAKTSAPLAHGKPAEGAETPEQARRKALVNKMHAIGMRVYGDRDSWNAGRAELCAWISDGATESITQLTTAQIEKVVEYLEEQQAENETPA